ncbi:MAG: Fibrillin-1, partial [Paramarteilia canceri]
HTTRVRAEPEIFKKANLTAIFKSGQSINERTDSIAWVQDGPGEFDKMTLVIIYHDDFFETISVVDTINVILPGKRSHHNIYFSKLERTIPGWNESGYLFGISISNENERETPKLGFGTYRIGDIHYYSFLEEQYIDKISLTHDYYTSNEYDKVPLIWMMTYFDICKHGVCLSEDLCFSHGISTFTCKCPSLGYRYLIREKKCIDFDECSIDGFCRHNGCVNTDGSFLCGCDNDSKMVTDSRISGLNTSVCLHYLTCSPAVPESCVGGQCIDNDGSFSCLCDDGLIYSKENSSCYDPCLNVKCSNNGVCNFDYQEKKIQCICFADYTGNNCEKGYKVYYSDKK